MEIVISTWLWGDKYAKADVEKLKRGVDRNTTRALRFVLFSDRSMEVEGVEQQRIQDYGLTTVPGCFARLRVFDPEWMAARGFPGGTRIVTLDLDVIITGGLGGLFERPGPFRILQGVNTTNPCPFNGSVWSLDVGYRPDVWTDFSLENYKTSGAKAHAFPDDQGWLYHKIPTAAAFSVRDGVYGFKKRGWPPGDDLPEGAKIVAFPGYRQPHSHINIKWVRRNWI